MADRYVVQDDGETYVTDDSIDDEILDMYGSGMFATIFRVNNGKAECAEFDDSTGGIAWKVPPRQTE